MSVVVKRLDGLSWTCYGGRQRPRRLCVRWGPSSPEKKATAPAQFLAHVYCDQTAGWMKTPLGTEVDVGPGHIVLDGDPAPLRKGHSSPPFSVRVYCSHGRPSHSQLVLSSCLHSSRQRVVIFHSGVIVPRFKIAPSIGDLNPHLIHGSLGPPESSTQTASRSVQSFLRA